MDLYPVKKLGGLSYSTVYCTVVFVLVVDECAGLYKHKEAKFEVYLPQYWYLPGGANRTEQLPDTTDLITPNIID